MTHPYIVAITGASGVAYGIRFIETLVQAGHEVHVVISESARLVFAEELNIQLKSLVRPDAFRTVFDEQVLSRLTFHSPKDFTAPIASGSFPVSGMAIVPCSMGTLGAVAQGLSLNLIHRAADCCLKEGRPLMMVPRETPLNAVHLENMLKLSRMNVKIVPAMPGFYSGLKTVREMVDFVVGKALDQWQIPHMLYPRWVGKNSKEAEDARLS